jgi:hypothetical protein
MLMLMSRVIIIILTNTLLTPTILNMRQIEVGTGLYILVDDEDYEWVSKCSLYCQRHRSKVRPYVVAYVKKEGKPSYVGVHRLIINAPKGVHVDHKNGNPLDNRKSNLRVCTNSQNSQNSKIRQDSKTGYKGVHKTKEGTYRARITYNGKRTYLKRYKDPVDAAKSYDAAARLYFGEFARTNFS